MQSLQEFNQKLDLAREATNDKDAINIYYQIVTDGKKKIRCKKLFK